jgi:hypothetical protein
MSEQAQRFEDFLEQVRARHAAGRTEYGDRSYSLLPGELAAEIQEELADVCGWSAVLWARLESAREAAARFKGRREAMTYHAAKPGLVVVQDSREKYTPRLPDSIGLQRAKLEFADYSAVGLTDSVALELKWSLDDLAACATTERARFETMLAGVAKYPTRALIVAASEADVWAHRYHSRLEPKALIASTWAWAAEYGVPTVWAWDAAGATEAIVWWLQRAAAKQKGRAA